MGHMVVRDPEAFSLDPSDKTQKRIKDAAHLAFIRTLPSVVSGAYGCEACHIRMGSPQHRKARTPAGRKPDDAYCLPLLPDEHREQHSGAEMAFWTRNGIKDPCGLALAIYAVTGQQAEAIKIIMAARRK